MDLSFICNIVNVCLPSFLSIKILISLRMLALSPYRSAKAYVPKINAANEEVCYAHHAKDKHKNAREDDGDSVDRFRW